MHYPAVGMDRTCDPFRQEAAGEYSISEAEAYGGGNPTISGQGGIHSEPQRAVCYTA